MPTLDVSPFVSGYKRNILKFLLFLMIYAQ